MKSEESKTVKINKYHAGSWDILDTGVIVEKPVSLTVNGIDWLTFMCTPSYLEALAIGFLFNEGLLNSIQDIASVRTCANQDNIDVWLNCNVEKPTDWRRTSGCTGGMTSAKTPQKLSQTKVGEQLPPEKIVKLVDELLNTQQVYREVGGVHTSILSDGGGSFIMAEDIGRHNTLDKISGRYLLEKFEFENKILITTGRVSSEMLQKAVQLNASIVVSRTSPSSLSVEMAHKSGITLIGYARRDRFNIYTNPNRIFKDNPYINLDLDVKDQKTTRSKRVSYKTIQSK
jgi:FdhD protein